MNLAIEAALASWLRSLDPFEGLAIHTGQSNEEIPGDQPVAIVSVSNNEVLGPSLYRIRASFAIATPAAAPDSLETHTALCAALRSAIFSTPALASHFEPPMLLAGALVNSIAESQDSGRWLSTAEVTLGITL